MFKMRKHKMETGSKQISTSLMRDVYFLFLLFNHANTIKGGSKVSENQIY